MCGYDIAPLNSKKMLAYLKSSYEIISTNFDTFWGLRAVKEILPEDVETFLK